jgi:hypothetical protein
VGIIDRNHRRSNGSIDRAAGFGVPISKRNAHRMIGYVERNGLTLAGGASPYSVDTGVHQAAIFESLEPWSSPTVATAFFVVSTRILVSKCEHPMTP